MPHTSILSYHPSLQFVYNCISDSLFSNSKVRDGDKGSLMDFLFIFLKAYEIGVTLFSLSVVIIIISIDLF